jgi:hypothetical protein
LLGLHLSLGHGATASDRLRYSICLGIEIGRELEGASVILVRVHVLRQQPRASGGTPLGFDEGWFVHETTRSFQRYNNTPLDQLVTGLGASISRRCSKSRADARRSQSSWRTMRSR